MATAIYTNIISQIQTILEGVSKIKTLSGGAKAVYPHPIARPGGYPAAIFFPANFDNSFATSQENYKIYRVKLYIVINATQTTIKNVYSTVLPNVCDEVLDAIDKGWSLTNINGHRTILKVDSGDWTVSEEKNGLEAIAEFNLDIKLLTNNS